MGGGNSAESRPWQGRGRREHVYQQRAHPRRRAGRRSKKIGPNIRTEARATRWGLRDRSHNSFSLPFVTQKAKRKNVCALPGYDNGSRGPFTQDEQTIGEQLICSVAETEQTFPLWPHSQLPENNDSWSQGGKQHFIIQSPQNSGNCCTSKSGSRGEIYMNGLAKST